VDWDDPVNDRVGNILLSRIMGADVRLDPAVDAMPLEFHVGDPSSSWRSPRSTSRASMPGSLR
jgi:hypothetical protein